MGDNFAESAVEGTLLVKRAQIRGRACGSFTSIEENAGPVIGPAARNPARLCFDFGGAQFWVDAEGNWPGEATVEIKPIA